MFSVFVYNVSSTITAISIQLSYLYAAKSYHPSQTQLKSVSSMKLSQPISIHSASEEERAKQKKNPCSIYFLSRQKLEIEP